MVGFNIKPRQSMDKTTILYISSAKKNSVVILGDSDIANKTNIFDHQNHLES